MARIGGSFVAWCAPCAPCAPCAAALAKVSDYVTVRAPNQVVSASVSPASVPSPTHAT